MNGLLNARRLAHCSLAVLCLTIVADGAGAHGGVAVVDDLCAIQIGIFQAHFKAYQPRIHGHQEFCEDLPGVGETVFVMEYLHGDLGAVPADFRIIKDITGHGRYASLEDVKRAGNLDAATVFYQPPVEKRDVYTVLYDFTEPGWYIGIVTTRHPTLDKVYTVVFPFKVGFAGYGWWPLFAAVAILVQLGYWFASGQLTRWRQWAAANISRVFRARS
jgi:hypothetical protein